MLESEHKRYDDSSPADFKYLPTERAIACKNTPFYVRNK